MLQNLQNFAIFQKLQLDNLVDFEKCCKTRIFFQRSVPIQPKTSNILPKFAETSTPADHRRTRAPPDQSTATRPRATGAQVGGASTPVATTRRERVYLGKKRSLKYRHAFPDFFCQI